MALDFHRLDNNDFLFGLNDRQFNCLIEIFESFTQWTGLVIDQYADMKLTIENQKTLIKTIDRYIDSTDLNKDKQKTSAILEFRGLLNFFVNHSVDMQLLGD